MLVCIHIYRAAQYRYEVLKTLDEINRETVEKDPSNRLDVKDAKVLNKNQEVFNADGRVGKSRDR